MKRRFRLTGSEEFQKARKYGRVVRLPILVMVYLPVARDFPRIGVVAGRGLGRAVQRNRARRLLRHAVKPFIPEIRSGWDILLIARKPLLQATFQEIQDAARLALHRSNILVETDEFAGH